MDEASRQRVFEAETQNVRYLKKAREQVKRTINYALRKNDILAYQVQTKLYALVFCSFAESNFYKLLHTPHGFSLDEIRQIHQEYKKKGLGSGWQKCLSLGLKKIVKSPTSNYIPNAKKRLGSIVETYIVSPSLIRNKIAHGQWEIALNKDNSDINTEITDALERLDMVTVSHWFEVNQFLTNIMGMIIQSPNRTFHRDYWPELAKLENYLTKTAHYSMEGKSKELQKKPIKHHE